MNNRRSGVRRGLLLVVVIGAWLAIAGVGGPALGSLSEVTNNDQSTYLPESAESVLAKDALAVFSEAQSLPAFVVLEGGDAYADLLASAAASGPPGDPSGGADDGGLPGAAYAQQLTDQITVDGDPLSDLLDAPPIAIPADDESGVLIIYGFNNDKVSGGDAGESKLSAAVDSMRDQLAEVSGADAAYVGGPAGLGVDTGEAFAGIDGVLLIVTLSVVLLILLVVYRSVVLPLFVLFSAVCGLALSGYVVYLLADSEIITLNGQSQGILSILVIGAATDYSLLVVARYREELQKSESRWDAMRHAWRRSIEPIAASAGTVIIGLLCLLLSDLNSNRGLGPVGALGIVAAFLVALTLLPALLLFGRWVFWPRIPRVRSGETGEGSDDELGNERGIWARVARTVVRRPRATWVGVGVVLLALCAAVPTFRASGTEATEVFLTDVGSVQAQKVLDEHYNVGATDPIQIAADPADADQLAEQLGALDGVESTRVAGEDDDAEVAEIEVIAAEGTPAESLIEEVRSVAHEVSPGSLVGGEAAVQLDTQTTAQSDLRLIIPVILIVVLLVLMALLRSVVAPIILVVATVISFGTAIGVSALVFNHVLGFPGADPVVPLLGFVFLVALGVDYSIFLMTRAREEVAGHGPVEGVTRALRVTGGVITSAGIVLAATFATLSVIPLLFMAQIAFIVAFGVLLDTLVVRSFLVPALAIDLGRRTWWPSRLSRTS